MEFNEKLQKLRKDKAMTQEELAEALFVSRTAVSKWESGRGYPNIDSLKRLAEFFGVTVDAMLSCDEVLSIAEEDQKMKTMHLQDRVFGCLDMSLLLLVFLPLLGQRGEGTVQMVSLLCLSQAALYLKVVYWIVVSALVAVGAVMLAGKLFRWDFWHRHKNKISFGLHAAAILVFIASLQPYAAALLFVFMLIKMMLIHRKI